jgi:predicted TIM-barrel fold metal-dependent hydrolase
MVARRRFAPPLTYLPLPPIPRPTLSQEMPLKSFPDTRRCPVWDEFAIRCIVCLAVATCCVHSLRAQEANEANADGPTDLRLADFFPEPKLKVASTELEQAKFPVVDAHSHFWIRLRHDPSQLEEFVKLMDRNNIAICVSLDGRLGSRLDEHLAYLWTEYEDRFVVFANIDWQGTGERDLPATWDCHQPDFARRTVMELEEAAKRGVSGLKVFKSFGLYYRNPDGSLIAIDDPRFDPIWDACGRLGLPVIMHTADPSAFFDPITPQNERYEELSRHPSWHFPEGEFPRREALHAARNRLFARHPQTKFIAAHLGNDGEDLQATARLLQAHPNVYVEIASRIAELGRQPYTAREFFIQNQDRILFGTDGPWPEQRYRYYWRFLETRDEYFPYSEKPFPPQGLWRIYGVFLPDEVLQKIYYENAARIIPGVSPRLERFRSGL